MICTYIRFSIVSKLLVFCFFVAVMPCAFSQSEAWNEKSKNWQRMDGYFPFYWDAQNGKIWMELAHLEEDFLYIQSLRTGVGSNDIGLDRNQLGQTRVVRWVRSGNKVLLQEANTLYRANTRNRNEKLAVEEAFASSVLWGGKIEFEAEAGTPLVDITSLVVSDAHQVALRLKNNQQGSYRLDESRSAVYMPGTKNFPKNTEFEAITTLVGEAQGANIRSVTPTPEAVTVRQHHSFVQLPDDGYTPRVYDARCGYFDMSYYDYATPISEPLEKKRITRHRLQKKDPSAARSEAVEPIIYYIDRGVPEPIKSALMEGASWWNEAFEAAGYINAFQVKELPEDADPMDIRYNLINWVHRSTRGWSYGSSVTDPRTGEIIKGHVLLGSLRVRQDYLIAQGLLNAYEDGKTPDPRMEQMALARLRQLSAHEVGHTLGLAHNFASSYNNRASVMDYPHPYITLSADGNLQFDKAYDSGSGVWDKRCILYGYQHFPPTTNEEEALQTILRENIEQKLLYLSDTDARAASGAHPYAHLWDNGTSAIDELKRISQIRKGALASFDEKNIPTGTPMANLEHVLIPLYFAERYQIEAVVKTIGGVNYSYAMRGDRQVTHEPVKADQQAAALEALEAVLNPKNLVLPKHIIDLIPPQPAGYSRGRENVKSSTGLTFDPYAAPEALSYATLSLLLHPQRLARIQEQHLAGQGFIRLYDYVRRIARSQHTQKYSSAISDTEKEIQRMRERQAFHILLSIDADPGTPSIIKPIIHGFLWNTYKIEPGIPVGGNSENALHDDYMRTEFERYIQNPDRYKPLYQPTMPDGAPIGCMQEDH